MHELSIAQGILDIIGQYVPEGQAPEVRAVRVRVGQMAGSSRILSSSASALS